MTTGNQFSTQQAVFVTKRTRGSSLITEQNLQDATPQPHLRTSLWMSPYSTQTNVLYSDSACCLPTGMENSRQSLLVWTCPRTVGIHSYFPQCVIRLFLEFVRLTCGRTKEFLLLLRVYSPVSVYGCAMCRSENCNKKGDAISLPVNFL